MARTTSARIDTISASDRELLRKEMNKAVRAKRPAYVEGAPSCDVHYRSEVKCRACKQARS